MLSLNECLKDFEEELKKGKIQKAYKGIFDFLIKIKNSLLETNPDYYSPGRIYHGYLDISYFPVATDLLNKHQLRTAVVFDYELFQLEVWFSGRNRFILKNYWELFKKKEWEKYPLLEGVDKSYSIMKHILRTKIDLERQEEILQIRFMIQSLIKDVEELLKKEGHR
ncbi:MAG: hypothetical protein CSA18_00550 [Deltaproteobacteria bacterium]|nr:MAG: hypothetical protein CSA18_00550 [Deltaproteobacteria bacterium]